MACRSPAASATAPGSRLGQPSAAKTGTTNSNLAVWFVGYTPDLATASMIAGANQAGEWITLNGQTVGGRYISSAVGSTNAGPMWGDAMKAIDPTPPRHQLHRARTRPPSGVG